VCLGGGVEIVRMRRDSMEEDEVRRRRKEY
jgi:hypothetical protein